MGKFNTSIYMYVPTISHIGVNLTSRQSKIAYKRKWTSFYVISTSPYLAVIGMPYLPQGFRHAYLNNRFFQRIML